MWKTGRYGEENPQYKNHALIISELEKHLGGLKGKKILDIGCGNGALLELLEKKHGVEGYGIDPAFKNVQIAGKRGLKRVVKGDATALKDQFPKRVKFDAVISSFVLEPFVVGDADAKRILRAAHSMTGPGGVQVHFTDEPSVAGKFLEQLGANVVRNDLIKQGLFGNIVVAKKPRK